jgi:hypothetical protein
MPQSRSIQLPNGELNNMRLRDSPPRGSLRGCGIEKQVIYETGQGIQHKATWNPRKSWDRDPGVGLVVGDASEL